VGVFGQNLPALFHEAERQRPGVRVVPVDMPIGLPDRSSRQADIEARKFVGPRASSVFPTPIRAVLDEEDYATACAISRDLTGKAISKQAHALRPRLAEVDDWVRTAGVPVIEVHPEVSFAEMAGTTLGFSKHAPEGVDMRRQLLESVGITVDPGLWGLGRLAKVGLLTRRMRDHGSGPAGLRCPATRSSAR
jgi:predicted RNase H-like nuclease